MKIYFNTIIGPLGIEQLIHLRWFFGLLIFLPFLPTLLQSHPPKNLIQSYCVHFSRGILNSIGIYTLIYAFNDLSFNLTFSLLFFEPVFVLLLSSLLLFERVVLKYIITAILFSFSIFITNPVETYHWKWQMLLPLIAAFCFALKNVITKKWGDNENPKALMVWLALITTISTLPLSFIAWKALVSNEYIGIIFITLASSIYSYFWHCELRQKSVVSLTHVTYSLLAMAFLSAIYLEQKIPSQPMLWSSAIVTITCLIPLLQTPRNHFSSPQSPT